MMDESDAALVTRVREGDQHAFRALVERHSNALFRLAYRMTGNEHDAEDMVQETFLRAYKQLDRFESRSGFATWLHRIAANCSLDLLRRRKRHEEQVDPIEFDRVEQGAVHSGHTPDHQVFHGEVRQKIESVLEELTPMERTAFVLRHFEGKTIEEIGSVLGTAPSATKQGIFRAVQKMRRALEPMVDATL